MRNEITESFTYRSLLARDNLDERKTLSFFLKEYVCFQMIWILGSFSLRLTCKIITQTNLKVIERRWQIKPLFKSKDTPGALAKRM